jgi:hypothetical protein
VLQVALAPSPADFASRLSKKSASAAITSGLRVSIAAGRLAISACAPAAVELVAGHQGLHLRARARLAREGAALLVQLGDQHRQLCLLRLVQLEPRADAVHDVFAVPRLLLGRGAPAGVVAVVAAGAQRAQREDGGKAGEGSADPAFHGLLLAALIGTCSLPAGLRAVIAARSRFISFCFALRSYTLLVPRPARRGNIRLL